MTNPTSLQPTHRPISMWDIIHCALIASALIGPKDIRELVDSIVNHEDFKYHHSGSVVPGTTNVTAPNSELDEFFCRGLINYRAGSALNWPAAEVDLIFVREKAKGTLYDEIAGGVLDHITPFLDRYAYALNSSD